LIVILVTILAAFLLLEIVLEKLAGRREQTASKESAKEKSLDSRFPEFLSLKQGKRGVSLS
jgi:hypothetical protein